MKITKKLTVSGEGLDMTFTIIHKTFYEDFRDIQNRSTTYNFHNYIEIEEVEFRRYIADLHEKALDLNTESLY